MNRVKAHALALKAITLNQRKTIVYLSVNARWGIFFTIVLSLVARLKKMRVLLHHHYYGHVEKSSFLLKVLTYAGGGEAVHITNCNAMSNAMKKTYPKINNSIGFSNIGVVSSSLRPKINASVGENIVLGHLSNLTQDKGIGTVIESYRKLINIFPNLKLHIAGPCSDSFATEEVAKICDEMGEKVVYFDSVYGEDKQTFFDSIDIFVYPTKSDTQGIVNLEALACGKPVVATSLCCIPGDIGEEGGVAVPALSDFSETLKQYIDTFISNPNFATTNARRRYETLLQEHLLEQTSLFSVLSGDEGDNIDLSFESGSRT